MEMLPQVNNKVHVHLTCCSACSSASRAWYSHMLVCSRNTRPVLQERAAAAAAAAVAVQGSSNGSSIRQQQNMYCKLALGSSFYAAAGCVQQTWLSLQEVLLLICLCVLLLLHQHGCHKLATET
jgi:hypothetical protein